MTASALYTGTVRHRRLTGRLREFCHPVAFALVDLDELPTLLGGRLVRRRPGLVRVRRRDLLGAGEGRSVADAVRAVVHERTGRPAAHGPVRVLTHPRTLGTCFNPVSFYYVHEPDERLDAVVAEVTNTPWGERHAYVMRGGGQVLRGDHAKALHVSPFQPMERRHRWVATAPGPTLSVHIANHPDGAPHPDFDATLALRRRPLTRDALARLTARYPAGSMRVLALIYGHALAMALRGIPYVRHPGDRPSTIEPAQQR